MRVMLKSKIHRACNFIPKLVYPDTKNTSAETKRALRAITLREYREV